MNFRFFAATRTRIAAAALTAACALLGSALPARAGWEHAHGDNANTGFARVDTTPAASPKQFAQLGPLAPGANPVVGPDGTVYIGNLAGQLIALHADGTPYWTRQLNGLHGGIFAAPVVGADGSIYVVSSVHYTDHRGGEQNTRFDSYLHKFAPGGGWVFAAPFPEQYSSFPAYASRGATTAPPNIWRSDGVEAVIVPAVYEIPGGRHLRLIAFSTGGAVLADQFVTHTSYEITGGSDFLDSLVEFFTDCFVLPIGCEFSLSPPSPLAGAGWPLPGVAIRRDPRGGTPFAMMSDGQHDKVAYSFSPQTGFSEVFRSTHSIRNFTTPPIVLSNGDTAVGTADGWLTFTGSNFAQLPAIGGLGILTAAPTRLADGRLAVVSREGRMSLLSGGSVTWQSQLAGESIASAAASCTHLFVATTHELVTFDASNMMPVARVPWVGGGLAAPVIGPGGHVYAIASDSLFVFPPPSRSRVGTVVGRTACDQLAPGFGGGTLAQ